MTFDNDEQWQWLGDISLVGSHISTPSGAAHLASSRWFVNDQSYANRTTPVWTIVIALIFFPIGLLALLIKDTRLAGFIAVTVTAPDLQHTTWISAANQSHVYQVSQQVEQIQSQAERLKSKHIHHFG